MRITTGALACIVIANTSSLREAEAFSNVKSLHHSSYLKGKRSHITNFALGNSYLDSIQPTSETATLTTTTTTTTTAPTATTPISTTTKDQTNSLTDEIKINEKSSLEETVTMFQDNLPVMDKNEISSKMEEVKDSMGFRNDGKYWFMKTGLGSYKEGMEVVNGVPIERVVVGTNDDNISVEEAAKLRKRAALEMVNINDDERQRRIDIGNLSLAIAAIYATYLVYFVDIGDVFGHFVRLSVIPFLNLGYGFRASGKAGL